MRATRQASCTSPSCRHPSTRVHCARPGATVRAVLGHSGGRTTIANLPTRTAEDKVAASSATTSGSSNRQRRPSSAHDGQRRGSSDVRMFATALERTHHVACAQQGDSSSMRQVAAQGDPSGELLREGQIQSQGGGTQQAEPNPSFEARPNGIALGPRSALVHHAPRGPIAIPSVPPQLER
jgi:hypothetical protein